MGLFNAIKSIGGNIIKASKQSGGNIFQAAKRIGSPILNTIKEQAKSGSKALLDQAKQMSRGIAAEGVESAGRDFGAALRGGNNTSVSDQISSMRASLGPKN